MSTDTDSGWRAGFKADYQALFVEEWSPALDIPEGVTKNYPWLGLAVILALAIGLPLAALLFQKKIIDPYVAIPATFWIGSLAGGLLFGIGMVFAGGCASGSLWRMGEGHLKLWVSMFFFAWVGSSASALFKKFKLTAIDESNVDLFERTAVGFQAYLPDMFAGWGATLLLSAALLALWYALVRYNESTERFTLM